MLEELRTCLQRYFSHIRQRRSLGVRAAGLLVVRGCTAMQTVGTDSQLGCQDRKAPRKGTGHSCGPTSAAAHATAAC